MKHSFVTTKACCPWALAAPQCSRRRIRRVLGLAAAIAAGQVQDEDLGDGRPTIEEARLGEGAPAAVGQDVARFCGSEPCELTAARVHAADASRASADK